MATAGTLEIDVVLNGKKIRIGLNDLKKRLVGLNKTAMTSNKIFGRLAKIASVGFLAKMTLDTAKLNRELGLLADRTGVGVETISKMRKAFQSAGGDAKVMDRVVSGLSRRIARSSMGQDPSFLGQLGLFGISGRGKTAEMLIPELADAAVAKLQSGQVNKAQLYELLQQIIPEMDDLMFEQLLKGGDAWLETINQINTLTREQNKSVAELNTAWSTLKTTMGTLIEKITSVFAPALTSITEKVNEFAKFAAENENITAAVAGLGALAIAIKGLGIAKAVAAGTTTLGALGVGAAATAGLWGLTGIAAGALGYGGMYGAVTGYKYLTRSEEEKDNALATEANTMGFTNIEDKLKWLSEQGSPYWKQQYESYMIKHHKMTPKQISSKPIVEPLFNENIDLTKTSNENNGDVNIDLDLIVQENPDGTYTTIGTISSDNSGKTITLQQTGNTINGAGGY